MGVENSHGQSSYRKSCPISIYDVAAVETWLEDLARKGENPVCFTGSRVDLLLDEPCAGVDPIAVEDSQSIVATRKHKNIGVIITDHNVDETLAITDRTYLLYEGKSLKTGTAEELAADPMVRKVYLGQHFELKKSHQLTQQMKNRKGQQAQQAGEETDTQE